MSSAAPVSFTYFERLTTPHGKRVATTWTKLLARLSIPRISTDKHAVPGLSLATYAHDHRKLSNVERVYAIGLDLDHLDALSVDTTRPPAGEIVEAPDWETLRRTFNASAAFVHTTWSSSLQSPRLRVFLLLSRPVTGEEYRRVYQAVATECERGGFVVDRAASDPSRFWFLPSIAAEGRAFVYWTCDGAPLDVEKALASVPLPPAPPPPTPRPLASGGPSAFDRARKYLAKCDPAIQGSGGRTVTFMTAQRLVRGFTLSVEDAFVLMSEWNQRCSPPWSDRELRIKCEEAATAGRMAEGALLDQERSR